MFLDRVTSATMMAPMYRHCCNGSIGVPALVSAAVRARASQSAALYAVSLCLTSLPSVRLSHSLSHSLS